MLSGMSDAVTRLNAALERRYAIERKLGEGGMATVYLADDLKHERKVALKVLKPELAAVVGAERFLAEIKVTANLQHPNILPLHDSGEADSFLFYVMPYVEGDTLKDRLAREHQLPVDDAVHIATDMAEALDYAHRQGVIHRDIKPANVLLLEGKPVISDFGIALAVGAAGGGRLTETGLSLGTPHYMSPEQATGDQAVGAATDTYALGSVLYEMLVGEPPYPGTTAQAVLGKIIAGKPVSAIEHRSSVPANVDAAVRRALEKLPADRFTSAQEFVRALEDPGFRYGEEMAAGVAGGRGQWTPVTIAATGLAVLFAITTAWSLLQPEPPQPVSRQVLSTEGWAGLQAPLGRIAALAPDGSSMVLPIGLSAANVQLGLKMRGSTEITPIPGTEQAQDVVYSPDGQWSAYIVGADVLKRPLVGGAPVTLAEDANPSGVSALAWLDDGSILYEAEDTSLDVLRWIARISEDGEPLGIVFGPEEQVVLAWARGLPDARGALVIGCPGTLQCGADDNNLYVVDLDDLSWEIALEQVIRAWYAPTGHVVYVRADGAVFAQPFDPADLELTGSAIPLFDGVRVPRGHADMRLAADGTLLYAQGSATSSVSYRLVFVDRDGREQPLGLESPRYYYPRVSPDGSRLAFAVADITADDAVDFDLWVFDLDRGSRSRITFGGNNRFYPTWTPAGDQLAFSDGPTGTNTIHLAAADGRGQIVALLERDGVQFPTSWSRDGNVLVYHETDPETLRDLWVFPVGGDPEPFLVTPFQERAAAFSPDGRWLAYVSDESGQDEVYVQPYPGPGPEFTVSTAGGREPLWSPDGSELFYRTEDQLMVVAVEPGDTFRANTPRPLFADPYVRDGANTSAPMYDIMPDGQRFVMVSANAEGIDEGLAVILVENWFEELKQRMGN